MDPKIPSSIRAAFVVEGSRGDIQPYVALALRLQQRGNTVKIFTNTDHVVFCESFGIPVEGVFYNFSEALRRPDIADAMAYGKAFKVSKSFKDLRATKLPDDLSKLWPKLEEFNPTLLLSGFLSKIKAILYSHSTHTPMMVVDLQIMVPLTDKGPVGLPTLPFGTNRVWFKLLLAGAKGTVVTIKQQAKQTLGIDFDGKFEIPIMYALMTEIPKFPTPICYGISTHVIPPHPEWPKENFCPCGFFTIDRKRQETQATNETGDASFFGDPESHAALTKFLSDGPPPVYLGWGSMICQSPEWMVTLALEALQHAGARGIVLGGWAGLGQEHVPEALKEFCETNVLFAKSAPHEWLFPQCACIVHHGGSGTTASSVRSGKPTIITPLMGDQFDFADGIQTVGCGVGLGQLSGVTGTVLGDAIRRCLTDASIRQTAETTGAQLRDQDGCAEFCTVLDEWLTNEYANGEWLRKHEALLRECEEAWKIQQASSSNWCVIS